MSSPTRLPLTGLPVARTGRHSATLAAWVTAHLRGRVDADAVVTAVTGTDEPHAVLLPDGPVGLAGLLAEFRAHRADGLRLVLPVPGDPRGLPGPGPFTDLALTAGEAVRVQGGTGPCWGLVPDVTRHGTDIDGYTNVVRWQAFPIPPAVAAPAGSGRQAARDLADGLREAVVALAQLDTARLTPEAAEGLAALRETRRRTAVPMPRSHLGAAQALWAQADRLQRIVDIAGADDGAAVDRTGATARRVLLRDLGGVARQAKVAAINAPLDG